MKMFRQDLFFPNFYRYGYRNNMSYPQGTTFNTSNNDVNYAHDTSSNNVELIDEFKKDETDTIDDTTGFDKQEKKEKKSGFRFGPIDFSDDRISLFGFSLAIDDIILAVLIFFLFVESDCDYALIIVLGLMLFNISLSSFNIFG